MRWSDMTGLAIIPRGLKGRERGGEGIMCTFQRGGRKEKGRGRGVNGLLAGRFCRRDEGKKRERKRVVIIPWGKKGKGCDTGGAERTRRKTKGGGGGELPHPILKRGGCLTIVVGEDVERKSATIAPRSMREGKKKRGGLD